jgi:hypothetical protein
MIRERWDVVYNYGNERAAVDAGDLIKTNATSWG